MTEPLTPSRFPLASSATPQGAAGTHAAVVQIAAAATPVDQIADLPATQDVWHLLLLGAASRARQADLRARAAAQEALQARNAHD